MHIARITYRKARAISHVEARNRDDGLARAHVNKSPKRTGHELPLPTTQLERFKSHKATAHKLFVVLTAGYTCLWPRRFLALAN